MKHSKETIGKVAIGESIFVAHDSRNIRRYNYLGLIDGYHIFMNIHEGIIKFAVGNEDSNDDLRNNIFSTMAEARHRVKVQIINLIDHYNRHQLRGIEIMLGEDDKKFLYKYQ